MARYIILSNWTDQGVKNSKDTVKRARAAAAVFEKAGGKLTQVLWTLGQYDLVLIAEAPNDEAIASICMQIGQLGNVRSCSLRAFDEKEIEQILQKL